MGKALTNRPFSQESFATFGAPSNSFHDPTKVWPSRIDYVMYGTPTSAAATSAADGPHWRLRSCEIRREQGEIRREKGATASTSTAGKAAADDGGGADVAAAAAVGVLTSSLSDHEAMEAVFELEEQQEQEREQGQSSPDSEEKDGEEVAALYAELQEALQQGQEEAVARANRHSWCEERQAFLSTTILL